MNETQHLEDLTGLIPTPLTDSLKDGLQLIKNLEARVAKLERINILLELELNEYVDFERYVRHRADCKQTFHAYCECGLRDIFSRIVEIQEKQVQEIRSNQGLTDS